MTPNYSAVVLNMGVLLVPVVLIAVGVALALILRRRSSIAHDSSPIGDARRRLNKGEITRAQFDEIVELLREADAS